MYADISKPPAPLPSINLEVLRPGLSLLYPLSRRGHGPGLIILSATTEDPVAFYEGVPSSLVKWAEEGYAVVQIEAAAFEGSDSRVVLREAIDALKQCKKCDLNDKVGLVYQTAEVVASALYADAESAETLVSSKKPLLKHIAGQDFKPSSQSHYSYKESSSYAFATPGHPHFHYTTESVSHTRNLQFLKPKLNGPFFDLEAIWDEHTWYEFSDRSVQHTMSTMVQQPYVNHVPTLTGGIGRSSLTKFYRDNFIFNNSLDTTLDLISRTIGIDRVIDEFIYKFTHDREIDWLLPGIPPTFQRAEIPFTAVVNIRGDRLYHEHISWDQGTALRQLGLMPDYLPFPYAVPGQTGGPGAKYEYRVPVIGIETADKMRDRNSVPSNDMFGYKVRQVQDSPESLRREEGIKTEVDIVGVAS
ncbi:hypothetical protein FGADI_2515 [Fusarium gaditjirri]|uniref:Carboxymethylenebutenolidase n=1 Tax=Fusarium gaditjirri TaxID=282569 RepID=A0A8H4TIE1_9HYPO|nr:hypothetical protein FGADI_2515 [Fusarium gaditjirri]